MPALNHEHFFDQADKLVAPPPSGAPRQVDLRRAISSAYYGVFHFTSTALADEFAGVTQRATSRYVLIYRSIDHRTLKDICTEIAKQTPPPKYAPYLRGFGDPLRAFARAALELQEKRHRADYNPEPRFRTSEAKAVIGTARSAVQRFGEASPDDRKAFLTLLICPPR